MSPIDNQLRTTADKHFDDESASKKLGQALYQCCNILRGPIGQDEYKTYLTPLLFFKRISDVYDEEQRHAEVEYGDSYSLFEETEIHRFVIPRGNHWADIRNKSENVGKAIIDSMMAVEKANPERLGGLFTSFDEADWTDKNKLSDQRLKDLVEYMSGINVGNKKYSADVMGDAYEFLIKKFADLAKKNAGEFYTPRTIVRLMVELLHPQAGESIYDPACGTGGMLIEAIRQIHNEKQTYGMIFGQEKNLSTSAIARMNLFLHGAEEFKVVQGDTLRAPGLLANGALKTFDCVLANPPFSLKKWGAEIFSHDAYGRNIWGTPPDSNADYAWIQHMVKSMNPSKGRLAVVMPQGALFHEGIEGKIRLQMVQSDKIEAVITLVGGVFYGAGVSACILLLNNHKPKTHERKICFIDASTIYTPKRAQNVMTETDIAKVYDLYKNYEDVEELCKIATLEDVINNGGSLSVGNYIEHKHTETIDPEKVKADFLKLVEQTNVAEQKLQYLLRQEGYLNE